jgi:Arc/MetJ-type ribon-helix-helix transcriptional regulator
VTISSTTGKAVHVALRLPTEDVERIDKIAADTGASRSDVMRSALSLLDPSALAAHVAVKLLDLDGGPE